MDKLSYSLGVIVAQNLKNQGITRIHTPDLANGISAVILGNQPEISLEDANKTVQEYLREKAMEKYGDIINEGRAFLTQNAKREGVVALENGLQYEILKEGDGPKPQATDTVTTHYHGTLVNGTVFDSSVNRNQPASFPVNRVIPGWTQALQMMPVGSKWKLFLPPHLAYGEQGAGDAIKPFSTLIFEVELLEVN
ncbi:MAG: FKBP-type peptidyl-prolyl cis-trans isomerase [Bacteroidota bacterium]